MRLKLKDQLEQYKGSSRQNLAEEKRQILEEHVRHLRSSGIGSSSIKVGGRAPLFELPDQEGRIWELASALKNGPVVLKFYRGTWCPYCNIELHAYHTRLQEFRKRHTQFVAISPEKPYFGQMYVMKEQVEFPVLSDLENLVARKFGLEFSVNDPLRNLMEEFGINLAERNGEKGWTLPVPGTFVISPDGRIEYGFAEPDFTIRADPEEVLAVLDRL